MKATTLIIIISGIIPCVSLSAQTSIEANPKKWTVHNREVDYDKEVIHLNSNESDGVLWLNEFNFQNGVIELDIKGKDLQGQSFVGVAFHGKDNETFDGIYFRPFNFQNAERKSHSVQYISLPRNDWSTLRNAFPGKYENPVSPVPDPNDWFHVRIVVNYPNVSVYVNNNGKPSLEIQQLIDTKQGKFGLWVGNGSEGWFKNLKIERTK